MSSVFLSTVQYVMAVACLLATLLLSSTSPVHAMPRLTGSDVATSDDHHVERRNTEVDAAFDQAALPKAIEYFQSVINDFSCLNPQPRVLPVQEMHPRADVNYATYNVVLHRCAHDSGCCQLSEICAPKFKEIIPLPILLFNSEKLVQEMSFVNHTECHCVSRKEYVAD